jgi:hypothetical protein
MAKTFGVAGESARHQADRRRQRQQELERLQQAEHNWDGGARGEEKTARAIAERCPTAVALHDRRMPNSRANIDHIVLVPSGVWVIDSKRMKGRIKVEDGRGGSQKLIINGNDRTQLVHKLTGQVNAVKDAITRLDPHVPVHGAFCFWLPIDRTLDFLNPFVEDNGLPVMHTWTINGYPLFHGRLMTRKLNSPGTLSADHAVELADALAAAFPPASGDAQRTSVAPPATSEQRPRAPGREPSAAPPVDAPAPDRMTTEEFKAMKAAEHERVWERDRERIEEALGGPVPALLTDRLSTDGAVWCHHALWHSRVYLGCIHGKVGTTFPYKGAASIVAKHHDGKPGRPQWRALTAFLEHLRAQGYVEFSSVDGRVESITVTSDRSGPRAP